MSAYQTTECDRNGPLYGSNPLKLALFGVNTSSTVGFTRAPEQHRLSWQRNVELVRQADAAGFEATIAHARWRGMEGASNPWGESFESFSWAAGMAAATQRIAIVPTCHMLTIPPVIAAKQLATIDHIAGGRVALNVVSGWFAKELAMFDMDHLDHDERYLYGGEWMEVVHKLLSSDAEFDLDGKYIKVAGGYQQPKAVQTPRPPLMNAGFSPVGHAFAAKWADVAFISPDPSAPDKVSEQVHGLKSQAAQLGRSIQVWVAASILARDTDDAAARDAERLAGEADNEAIDNFINWVAGASKISDDHRAFMIQQLSVFSGGYPLKGSHQSVAEQLSRFSEAGVDGVAVAWLDYEHGLPDFISNILPLLERKGLRDTDRR